jgi:heme/copper-type cytochrome/quinol oxidase subunit 3
MFVCKAVLIGEWVLITTPNTILAAASGITDKYNIPYAYSITQRMEPAIYASVCLMLSSLYMYYAYVMFRRYRDQKIRVLMLRLLYANCFLLTLDLGNIIAEYMGGGVVETCYLAFFYSFVRFH